jgi:hypothetical protein
MGEVTFGGIRDGSAVPRWIPGRVAAKPCPVGPATRPQVFQAGLTERAFGEGVGEQGRTRAVSSAGPASSGVCPASHGGGGRGTWVRQVTTWGEGGCRGPRRPLGGVGRCGG